MLRFIYHRPNKKCIRTKDIILIHRRFGKHGRLVEAHISRYATKMITFKAAVRLSKNHAFIATKVCDVGFDAGHVRCLTREARKWHIVCL